MSTNKKQEVHMHMQNLNQSKFVLIRNPELNSLHRLKKKFLNEFGYEQSQTKSIQLSFMRIYPNQPEHIKTPIFSDQGLKLILTFLNTYNRQIIIQGELLIS